MSDVYKGSVPTSGKNLYPSSSDDGGPAFEPNVGPGSTKTTGSDSQAPGASFSGGTGDGLLKESGYHPGGEERVSGEMKIIDENNVSHNA